MRNILQRLTYYEEQLYFIVCTLRAQGTVLYLHELSMRENVHSPSSFIPISRTLQTLVSFHNRVADKVCPQMVGQSKSFIALWAHMSFYSSVSDFMQL